MAIKDPVAESEIFDSSETETEEETAKEIQLPETESEEEIIAPVPKKEKKTAFPAYAKPSYKIDNARWAQDDGDQFLSEKEISTIRNEIHNLPKSE